MKIVWFGYDFFHACLLRLLDDGHEIVKIYTFKTDNLYNFNNIVYSLAETYKIPISDHIPTLSEIEDLRRQGVDLFFSSGYAFKIPVPNDKDFRGINLHPSLLPRVRGLWPLPVILLKEPEAAGLSFHKLSPKWDEGDVLLADKIELTQEDDLESLSAKCQMRSPDLLSKLLSDFENHWQNSVPQDGVQASYYSMPSLEWRTIDFDQSVAEIEKILKAFGRFESRCVLNGKIYWIKLATTWAEPHDYRPGSVACVMGREIVVAAKDGFVCLKDYYEATNP
jgi:methionyl-tRNA formyltransferase